MAKQLLRKLPSTVRDNKPRSHFGEQTYGNSIEFTIDGEETFRKIYTAISSARISVFIANYDMDPSLKFVRANPHTTNVISVQRRKAYSLQELLLEKARQGVEIKIIVWEPRAVLRILPGADERGIDGRADQVERVSKIAQLEGIDKNLMVRVDSTAPTLTSAHHEKIIVVDNQIGFCGGFDLSKGKWDTSNHDYSSPLRDPEAEPWHDLHLMAKGPVVWDLVYHFHQRWLYSTLRNADKVRRLRIHSNYTTCGNEGTYPAVALRTWKLLNRNGGIKSWYASMFRKATQSIYIENQFPFQDRFATDLLAKRLLEQPSLKVLIVGPMKPNLPGFVGSILARMSVNDVRENLARLRRIGKERVRTFSLVSQDKTDAAKRRQIYVHSKVMIVDDKWITVGSANIDKNGFGDSSELDIGITSADAAIALRSRLWSEHLGFKKRSIISFESGYDEWDRLALHNGQQVQNGLPIKGHVYYYNFEEMGCPRPYPEADKSTDFAFL